MDATETVALPIKSLMILGFCHQIFFSHGQHLSSRPCHTAGMKNRHLSTRPKTQRRVLASFGRASLVRIAGANCELRGASEDDFTAAKEWISLFLHEAVLCDAKSEISNLKFQI
jgi:hypothetical protein